MIEFFNKYFKGGITRIPKDQERTFFFYATIVFFLIHLAQRFFEGAWFN